MILPAVVSLGKNPALPWLIWIHGFLGSQREWQPFADDFIDWPQIRLDLPGHGAATQITALGFDQVDRLVCETLAYYQVQNYWLIGYSLGGRVAMYHACQPGSRGLCGLIVEGGHPGLSSAHMRDARLLSDQYWVKRLRDAPIAEVLDAWYRQPVFASLNDQQRAKLVTLRSQNNPLTLATMLESTSLGNQPDLTASLWQLSKPFYYLCGERDKKFRLIAQNLHLTPLLIAAAGHNAHRENPAAFSACLRACLLRRHYDLS